LNIQVISAAGSPEEVLQAALTALATRAAAAADAAADGGGTSDDAAAAVNFAALPPNAFAVSICTKYKAIDTTLQNCQFRVLRHVYSISI
jgi:hypothetical protein